jgi:translation initiation factor 1
MGKKPPPSSKSAPLGESQKLTHNPFASIAGATGKSAPPVPAGPPSAATDATSATRKGRLILAREKKHRGGKAVVVVRGFEQLAWESAAIEQLATEIKRALGCGGTVESGCILVQGDRPAQVADWLRAQGFRVDGVTS